MRHIFKVKAAFLSFFAVSIIFSLLVINGCDDSGVVTKKTVDNPNVESFDSIWVEETIDSTSFCGMNLFNGTTVIRDSITKDCQLSDSSGTGINFYLRSGDLLILNLPQGFQTRFNRLYLSMSKSQFDTITVLPVGRDTILPNLDFTSDDTRPWGFFNDGLSGDQPVYSFWLEGKSINFNGRNIFGILQAIQSHDSNPGNIGGYKMSFRVRINTAGQNDFRQTIEQ